MKKSVKLIIAVICEIIFLAAGAVTFKFLSEPYTLIETLNRIYYGLFAIITLDIFSIVFFVLTVIRILKTDSEDEKDRKLVKRIKGTQEFFIAFCVIFVFSVISTVAVLNATAYTTSKTEKVINEIGTVEFLSETDLKKQTEIYDVFMFWNKGAAYFDTGLYRNGSEEKSLRFLVNYAENCNPKILKSVYDENKKQGHLGMDLTETKGKTENGEYSFKYNNDIGMYILLIYSGNTYADFWIEDSDKVFKDENEVLKYCMNYIGE